MAVDDLQGGLIPLVARSVRFTSHLPPVFKSLFVCDNLPVKGTRQNFRRDINTKLTTANFSHTNTGLTSMNMNCTTQEIVIQLLDDNTFF